MAKNNWNDEIAEAERNLREKRRKKAKNCDHNSGEKIVELKEYNAKYPIQDRSLYPDTAVIHPDCGTIFDARQYTYKETFDAFFRAKSMIHQIKYLTNANNTMPQEKLEELNMCLDALENVESTIRPFYNEMTKNLEKSENENRQKKSRRQYGHIGIKASMYGG